MQQNIKNTGLVNWVTLLVAVIGMLLISRFVSSVAGLAGTLLAGFGLFVALLSYCQMSLEAREALEKLEMDELSKTRGGASIFAKSDDDTFPAKRSREQFERYFIPALTILLLLLQVAGAFFIWRYAAISPPINVSAVPLTMALLGLLGLILFLLGKYSSGLARLQKQRLLRPGAAYLLLSAYACFVVVLAVALPHGTVRWDFRIARVLCVVAGLVALETLAGLVMEIYRVRVKGKESRLLYESRLVGLLGQPEAIITTAAHALDYQFGFKVSDTWFYRFLERSLAWLILAQVAILVISSCFVVIEPGEQALLERFGEPVAGRGVIGPGLHFKFPWPVDHVYRYQTERIQSFIIGAEPETAKVVQWTVRHTTEFGFLVSTTVTNLPGFVANGPAANRAPPVNELAASIPIQYLITNLTDWAYVNNDPSNVLASVATREVTLYLAKSDLTYLMSAGRSQSTETLHDLIQAASDSRRLGVRITYVGLVDIHPPTQVAKSYEDVVGAREGGEAMILGAHAHAVVTNAAAGSISNRVVTLAEADRDGAITNAVARSNLYTKQLSAYLAAPGDDGVYERRAYLTTLLSGMSAAQKKVILADGITNVIEEFNLEEKTRTMADLSVPGQQ